MLGGLAVKGISDIENVGLDFTSVIVLEGHHARGRRIFQRLAPDMDFMVRDDRRLLRLLFLWLRRSAGLGLLFCWTRRGSWGWWPVATVSLLAHGAKGKEEYGSDQERRGATQLHGDTPPRNWTRCFRRESGKQ